MTSKFTSRFRRRDEAALSSPAEAEKPAVEPVVDAAKPTDAKVETATSEAAAEPKPAEAATTPKQAVPPSRLVEVEKPKAARPDLMQAKMWLDQANAYRVPASIAAALLVALGIGYGIGRAPADGTVSVQTARLLETTTRELRDANGQIGQLAAELKAVKGTVDGIKGERDKTRGEVLTKQAQLSDRFDRAGQENATRIGRLAEQLDRIEKAQRGDARPGSLDKTTAEKAEKTAERSDKPEKVAAAPTPPAKPALDVTHTGSIGEAKTAEKIDPRKTPLDGYVVRDYDEGFALIETRSGRYIDVAVGYTLPGVGKVEAIERRGRQWVVVTPKGYIGER